METKLRKQVVALIAAGESNYAIRDKLGVSINQVAGVRFRDFPRRMTQAEARALPKTRPLTPQQRAALAVIPGEPVRATRILAAVGSSYTQLRRLAERGLIEPSGGHRKLHYRRIAP